MRSDRAKRATIACLALMLAAGCQQRMQDQPKYEALERGARFPDDRAAQRPPAGTVPRSASYEFQDAPLYTVTEMRRGHERFEIFCAPCHGLTGTGDGTVVQRGFPAPPSYHSARLRESPDQHFYDVMTNGYGIMYSYADRVPVADRWAIVAYIRALQLSQNAEVGDYPGLEAEVERSQADKDGGNPGQAASGRAPDKHAGIRPPDAETDAR